MGMFSFLSGFSIGAGYFIAFEDFFFGISMMFFGCVWGLLSLKMEAIEEVSE